MKKILHCFSCWFLFQDIFWQDLRDKNLSFSRHKNLWHIVFCLFWFHPWLYLHYLFLLCQLPMRLQWKTMTLLCKTLLVCHPILLVPTPQVSHLTNFPTLHKWYPILLVPTPQVSHLTNFPTLHKWYPILLVPTPQVSHLTNFPTLHKWIPILQTSMIQCQFHQNLGISLMLKPLLSRLWIIILD